MSFTPLGTVQPGDVIAADLINAIVADINLLGALPVEIGSIGDRVSALEASVAQILDRLTALEAMLSPPASPPDKTTKEGKESKEGKEGKDTKDGKEKEQVKDIKDASKDTKELSKDAKDAKEQVKEKDKEKEKDTKENVKEKDKDKERVKEGKEVITDKADRIEKLTPVEKLRDVAPGPRPLIQEAPTTPVGAGEPLAHFIPATLRPDLSLSPLRREPDVATVDGTGLPARDGG
jgi:hypothetical protein